MSDNNTLTVSSDSGCIATYPTPGSWYEYTTPKTACEPIVSIPYTWYAPINNNKKGDDDMRYLYEVVLVNPKNDTFYVDKVVARSETSALMEVYKDSPFLEMKHNIVPFDDLKTQCRILMSWKKVGDNNE